MRPSASRSTRSYTEGLEESPVAPNNALNRNVAAPALQTEQYDAGVRWDAFANMKLIAGVFNIEKPYFDLDAAGFFTELGTVEHRGVEVSLAGDPREDLTVIVGTRWLDATVSGPTVDAGLIGEKPVGTARQYSLATADYRFAGTGASARCDRRAHHQPDRQQREHDRSAGPRRPARRRPLPLQDVRQAGDAAAAWCRTSPTSTAGPR